MNNNSAQNGRQPPTPRAAPPTDPRIRPAGPSNREICKDFVWGICKKGAQCKFRHELELEFMKETLKFCHDFQNKTGCIRPDCGYLHASTDEETLFRSAGQIPRALATRYAIQSATSGGAEPSTSTAPVMFMHEFLAQPPPPPPPPPVAISPAVAAPPPPPATQIPNLLAPPPPPPLPTASTTIAKVPAPTYTAPLVQNTPTMLSVSPSSMPTEFDPTRPPPPIVQKSSNINRNMKRPADFCEAGPSKAQKREDNNVDICEDCVQRKIRIELYRKQQDKVQRDYEIDTLVLETKTKVYESVKAALSAVLSPEMMLVIDSCLEEQISARHQIVFDLLESFSDKHNNSFEDTPSSSFSLENSLLHTASEVVKRLNHVKDPTPADVAFLEMLRNGDLFEREGRKKESSAGMVTYNGQRSDAPPIIPSTSRYNPPANQTTSRYVTPATPSTSRYIPPATPSTSRYIPPATPNTNRYKPPATPSPNRYNPPVTLTHNSPHPYPNALPASAPPSVAPPPLPRAAPAAPPPPPGFVNTLTAPPPPTFVNNRAPAPSGYQMYQEVPPPPPMQRPYYAHAYPVPSTTVMVSVPTPAPGVAPASVSAPGPGPSQSPNIAPVRMATAYHNGVQTRSPAAPNTTIPNRLAYNPCLVVRCQPPQFHPPYDYDRSQRTMGRLRTDNL